MMKLLLALLITALLAGCAAPPVGKDIAVKTIEGSTHTYIESEKIDRFLVNKPEAFKQFDKVILFATQFDKLTISAKADKKMAANWNDSNLKEMDAICQQLDDFAQKIFSDHGDFVPVTRGGEDVLAIQFSLIDFMPYAARYENSGASTVGAQTNNSGIGQITVRGVLANAKTGELVAVIEDTLEVNARNSSNGNLAAMQDGNNKAAQNLAWRTTFRRFIDNLHAQLLTLKQGNIKQSSIDQSSIYQGNMVR